MSVPEITMAFLRGLEWAGVFCWGWFLANGQTGWAVASFLFAVLVCIARTLARAVRERREKEKR